jgi:hypothetical protein
MFSLEIHFKLKNGHCCSRAWPSFFLPRPAHALTRSPRAPPAPLLPHDVGHHPTSARLRRSRAAAGTPGPVLLLPLLGAARTGPHLLHPSQHAVQLSRPPSPLFSSPLRCKSRRVPPFTDFLLRARVWPPEAPYPSPSLICDQVPASWCRIPPPLAGNCREATATPISSVSSAARHPLAKTVVPHRSLSLVPRNPAA